MYSFDRLPPGTYSVKFELTGFRPIEHTGVRVSAAFVASIDVTLDAGGITETVLVTGASPNNLSSSVFGQAFIDNVYDTILCSIRITTASRVDLRLSRAFAIGGTRKFTPQEFFYLGNASTVVRNTPAAGTLYLARPKSLHRAS